ncbi:hypothetical protein KQH42_27780 [Streptomyces sp. CHA1]|uniref:DUF6082 family protein n=1 Tax=Streptomyces TaxID=1883 RepID=UPI001BFC9567|nr:MULTISPECIES: DUF6082 family protein [unclassified Streptomyces]MBT3160590.1 hypothetical protein [Streptomyces sp. G11C]MCO6704230.1 hypothetical protein [Streptomyces sp. CHB9.2]MCO6710504.1 hypothetical protein [Streptomyces sp. CHA3]MCO6716299.1 hypothetical protein [Streptomyces sp. CHB19.2]MCO6722429.1 hypothetical protein [Streptomyces sp. Vc714c-19]
MDEDEDEAVRHVAANRWVTLWSLMLRTGYTPEHSLNASLFEFMKKEPNRAFWQQAGSYRAMTARDRHDRRFVRLAEEAYQQALNTA